MTTATELNVEEAVFQVNDGKDHQDRYNWCLFHEDQPFFVRYHNILLILSLQSYKENFSNMRKFENLDMWKLLLEQIMINW